MNFLLSTLFFQLLLLLLYLNGDMLILGLWETHMKAIIGVRFGDSDADTGDQEGMDKYLDRWGK